MTTNITPRAERPFNSWDALKLIALAFMFVDHTGLFFYPHDMWLRAIGRGAAPIFLFLAGYAKSYRFSGEVLLLAVAITISTIAVSGELHPLNILFLILASRMLFDRLERRGKHITRPYEWYVSALALFSSMCLVQYGSLGLLFAICGYMMRHPDYYSAKQQQRFLALTFATYAIFLACFDDYTNLDRLIMALTLFGVYLILRGFQVRTLNAPRWITHPSVLIARYSGYIFAAHIILFEWITRVPY